MKTKRQRVSDVPITFARAVPMTRLNRAREVNPTLLRGTEGAKRGRARWKFTLPAAFPNRYTQTSMYTFDLEMMAGTEESEVLQIGVARDDAR